MPAQRNTASIQPNDAKHLTLHLLEELFGREVLLLAFLWIFGRSFHKNRQNNGSWGFLGAF
jgi:hypothetical protein